MKRNRGFTLIELMIVICIMCIIISIIMPSFMRARSMAQYTGCQSNLKSIATAVELYATESESRYPTSIDVLPPQFIGHLPTCPSCQLGYSYTYTTVPGRLYRMVRNRSGAQHGRRTGWLSSVLQCSWRDREIIRINSFALPCRAYERLCRKIGS